jgi:hypothetical protein
MVIRKLIFNIAIVAGLVFLLDFAIGRTLRHFYFKETSGFHFRTTYSMETAEADVLIFGSSSANHHYVPEVFEDSLKMTFYNTGRDGNGVLYQTAILKSIIKRYTPKIIILDFAGGFEKGDDIYDRMSSLLPYYRTHGEIRKIIELKSPFEKIKLLSELYPFNSQILSIAIGNMEINKTRNPDNKGFVALHGIWNAKIDSIANSTPYEVDSIQVLALREFLNIAKNSGAKVYLIHSPMFQKFNKSQEIDILRDIAAFDSIPFWDFSKDTAFLNDNQLFRNQRHLNQEGAIKFSNVVVDKIKHDLNKNIP